MDSLYLPTNDSQNYYASTTRAQSQIERAANNTSSLLALATPEMPFVGYHLSGDWHSSGNIKAYEDFISEEESRMRSLEIAEHDDMQNLLRSFGIGHHRGLSQHKCRSLLLLMLTLTYSRSDCEFALEHRRSNGKAIVGWLKLKTAFRWGIFVRKRAVKRRVQLVELD